MVKLLLVALMLFSMAQAQDELLTIDGNSIGWSAIKKYDTIKALILIGQVEKEGQWTTATQTVSGYAVRQQHKYYGDQMPPGDYKPYWVVIGYLNSKKKKFDTDIIIWQAKTKP